MNLELARAIAEEAAKEAGAALLNYQSNLTIQIKKGNSRDIVTNADTASDAIIRKAISRQFPGHRIVTEEANPKEGREYTWHVDPLDGTNNYSKGNSLFCVSIALCEGSEILMGLVYSPVSGETYSAIKDRGR